MVVTRSYTKWKAATAASTNVLSEHNKELISTQEGSRLLDLPPELLLHVLNFVIEDEAPRVSCNIKEESTGIIVKEPPIAQVCQLLRHESMPLFYSRKAFFLNFETDYGYEDNILRKQAKRISRRIRHMKKVTFFGRGTRGGQASITFDLNRLEMTDARWAYYDHGLVPIRQSGRGVDRGHSHFGPIQLECFQRVLDRAKKLIAPFKSDLTDKEFRSLSALLGLLEGACRTSYFMGSMPRGIASKGPGPGSGKSCKCNGLIAVGTHEVVRHEWPGGVRRVLTASRNS